MSSSAVPKAHQHSAACKIGFFCSGKKFTRGSRCSHILLMCCFSLEEVLAGQHISVLTPTILGLFARNQQLKEGIISLIHQPQLWLWVRTVESGENPACLHQLFQLPPPSSFSSFDWTAAWIQKPLTKNSLQWKCD